MAATRRSARVAAAATSASRTSVKPEPKQEAASKKSAATKKAPATRKPAAAKKAAPAKKPAAVKKPAKKRGPPASAKAAPVTKHKKTGWKQAVDSTAPLGHVDPMAGVEGDIYLHQADGGSVEPLDAMLVLQDLSKRMDKFYVLQLIELDKPGSDGCSFVVYQRWGRTGTAGQGLNQTYDDVDVAVEAYMDKFTEKTQLSWEARETAPPVAGHYVFVKQNFVAKAAGYATARWEYWVDDGVDGKDEGWYSYTSSGAQTTEQLYIEFQGNPSLHRRYVNSGNFDYEVDLVEMSQVNITHPNATKRFIRRVAPNTTPDACPPEPLQAARSLHGSNSFSQAQLFAASVPGTVDPPAPQGHVDPMAGVEGDIYLHQADDGSVEPLDAMLVLQDPSKQLDNFYVLQLIELDEPGSDGCSFVVYQRWGRTGTAGQGLNQTYDDVDDAVEVYMDKFTEKTQLSWEERETASPVAGHYVFVKQNFVAKAAGYATARWEYWVDDGVDGKDEGWYSYTSSGAQTTEQLYMEFQCSPSLHRRFVNSGNFDYEVNLVEMTQVNVSHPNATKRFIRRVAPNAIPDACPPEPLQTFRTLHGSNSFSQAQLFAAYPTGTAAAAAQVQASLNAVGAAVTVQSAHVAQQTVAPPKVHTAMSASKPGGAQTATAVAGKPAHCVTKPPPAKVAAKSSIRKADPDVSLQGLNAADLTVVKMDNGDWYDVVLNQCNITSNKNNNKYYKIAMYQNDATDEYYVWTKWGRVGEPATRSSTAKFGPYEDSEAALVPFAKKFKDKTGNAFGTDDFKEKKGKYVPIEIDHDAVVPDDISGAIPAKEEAEVDYLPTALDPKTFELVCTLFSKEMQSATLESFNLDLKRLPLGVPSSQQIQRGVDVLDKISNKLAGNGSVTDSFQELSSAFYTAIPHSFGRQRPPAIDDSDKLQSRYDMCDILSDMHSSAETVRKVKEAQPKKKIVPNPTDQHYLSMNAELNLVSSQSDEFALIKKYFDETCDTGCRGRQVQLLDAWKVDRAGEAQRFQAYNHLQNRKLLWHGSSLAVIAPILTSGLRIMPHSGGRVGKGIYLASLNSKSAGYTSSYGAKFACMFLAEAALGKQHLVTSDGPHASGLQRPPPGTDSVLAQGVVSPSSWTTTAMDGNLVEVPNSKPKPTGINSTFNDDEFLVYAEAQVRIRYVVTVKLPY